MPVGVLAAKIHTVDTGNKSERDKYYGNDGEHLHDLVHAVAYHTQIKVYNTAGYLFVAFYHIHRLDAMVVRVAQKKFGFFGYFRAFAADHIIYLITLGPARSANDAFIGALVKLIFCFIHHVAYLRKQHKIIIKNGIG